VRETIAALTHEATSFKSRHDELLRKGQALSKQVRSAKTAKSALKSSLDKTEIAIKDLEEALNEQIDDSGQVDSWTQSIQQETSNKVTFLGELQGIRDNQTRAVIAHREGSALLSQKNKAVRNIDQDIQSALVYNSVSTLSVGRLPNHRQRQNAV